jgi:predicted dehydrogenase
MSEKIKVGVVGGGIGRAHIAAFQRLSDQFDVQVICDLDETKAQQVAQEFSLPRSTCDLTELLRMDELDVIDLCTPSYLHYRQTVEALAAGKHVICEKPIAGSLQQVDEMLSVEKQTNKRVMPIFQYRFGHGLQKLKWLQGQSMTGRAWLTTSETAWRRRADYYAVPWRGKWQTELGGTLVTHAIHAHDALYYILGPAKSVAAHLTTLVNPNETDDLATATLSMADGSLCTLAATTGSAQEISRQRFCFSRLTAESNLRPYDFTGDPWTFMGDTPEVEAQITECLAHFKPLPEGWEGQFYRFYEALQSGGELPVTLADARASLELATALYYSAQTRQFIDLPLDDSHPMYTGWQPSAPG